MGFLSKISKGIKGAFKKIGKGIKGAFKSIGKFMDKIGIVGQIGLSLLLPGIGQALGGMWQGLVGTMQGYAGVGSSVIQGAGNFLAKATEIAGNIAKPFTTITEGVKNVVGETLKAGANALGVDTALIKVGDTLGSDYLKGLGESISAANLESIGTQFKTSVGDVVDSFKNISGVPSTSPKLTNGAVTPQPEISYDPDIVTPDMPAAQVKTDSLLAPDVDVTSPAVGDPSVVGNKQLAADADFLSIEAADFSDPQKRGFFGKTYDRLAAEGSRMLREAPTKAMDKLGSTLTDIPSQYAKKLVGLSPDPTYTQVSYATVVPTIQEAPMVGTSMGIDPVQYVANNQQSMGLQPFGFNANMYNEATYINTMRKYGLA